MNNIKRFKIIKTDKYRLYRVRYLGFGKQLIATSATLDSMLDVVKRLVKGGEVFRLRYEEITYK